MAEVAEILAAIESFFESAVANERRPLAGRRAVVTSGPTREPIDPVRYLSNRSSGKQGHAIASALAALGAEVTLVAGPTEEADPPGVTVVHVETAAEMLTACTQALPADVVVCAAAVADWRVAGVSAQKIKKGADRAPPTLALVANPDILATLAAPSPHRPTLVVGFAAETENLIANATAKLATKGCDWILANDVSAGEGVFGGEVNRIHFISRERTEPWPTLSKRAVAERLARRIAEHLAGVPA